MGIQIHYEDVQGTESNFSLIMVALYLPVIVHQRTEIRTKERNSRQDSLSLYSTTTIENDFMLIVREKR